MKLVSNNQHLVREIYRLEQEIVANKQVIRENEKVIWRNCKHQWVYDDSCGPYERINFTQFSKDGKQFIFRFNKGGEIEWEKDGLALDIGVNIGLSCSMALSDGDNVIFFKMR